MALYRVVTTCELFGSQYDADSLIELTEDQEKQLKVGKFMEEIPDEKAMRFDPKSKKTIKIGNKNIVKANRSELQGREGKPFDEGQILYPPSPRAPAVGESRSGAHATTFQTMR